jgi:hypothetical protein
VLGLKATMDLCGGMPLLGRSVLVVGQDLIDDRRDRTEDGSRSVSGPRGWRHGMREDMPDRFSCMSKLAGDLSDRHAIATSPPDCAIVVHRKHVLGLRVGESIPGRTFTLTKAAQVGSDRRQLFFPASDH